MNVAEQEDGPTPDGSPDHVRRVLGRGSLYTIATAAQLGAAVLVIPALTRILSPEEYGTVAAALVVFSILGVVAGLGIPAAITRVFFRDEGRRNTQALVLATFVAALLVVGIAEITGPAWSKIFAGISFGGALELAVVAALPFAVLTATQNILQAADRPGAFVATAAIATAAAQLLGLAGAARWDAAGYMGGLCVGVTIAALLGLRLTGIRAQPLRSGSLLSGSLRVGLPTVPHGVALYLLAAGDRVVIERLEGLAAVGRYQIAYVIGSIALTLTSALNNAWAPVVFGSGEERRWDVLADTTSAVMRLAALVAGALALGAPLALQIMAPGSYGLEGLATVSALVALSVVPFVWYLANVHVIFWLGHTSVLAWSTPVAAAVNVAANLALIPVLGLKGAAVTTLLSYLLMSFIVFWRSRTMARVRWDYRSLLTSAALAAALVLVAIVTPTDGVSVVLRTGVALGLGVLIALSVVGRGPVARRRDVPDAPA